MAGDVRDELDEAVASTRGGSMGGVSGMRMTYLTLRALREIIRLLDDLRRS